MGSHTKGPWEIRYHTVGFEKRRQWIEINAPLNGGRGEHPICRIIAGFTNQEADARLIAAAPELFDLVRRLADAESSYDVFTMNDDAISLVAKVKGVT